MVVICGFGGCGKIMLVFYFVWKCKVEYEGGVFWIFMEDDCRFENFLNDLVLCLGVFVDLFDFMLLKVFNYFLKSKKVWLMVFDDVD